MLRKLTYWTFLGDDDCEALLALPHTLKIIEPHTYIVRDGDYIVRDGDKPTHSCLMPSGFT